MRARGRMIPWEADPRTLQFTYVGEGAEDLLGYPREAWYEPGFWKGHVHPDDVEAAAQYCAAATASGRDHCFEYRMVAKNGRVVWVEDIVQVRLESGRPMRFWGAMIDVTEIRRAEGAVLGQNRILEMVARGAPLKDTLRDVCLLVESQIPDARCSILLVNGDGTQLRTGAGPNLPDEYNALCDGIPVGPRHGCCGTAAYLGEPVIAADILTDPLWAGFSHTAAKFNLRSCWSTPFFSGGAERRVLGTFALYKSEVATPSAGDVEVVARAAHLAGVAVQHERSERDLRESEQRFRDLAEGMPQIVWVANPEGAYTYCNSRAAVYSGKSVPALLGFGWKSIVHPDDAPLVESEWKRAVVAGSPMSIEYRKRRADGVYRWHLARAVPVHNGAGRIARWIGTCTDVDEAKQIEARLREERARYRAVIETSRDGFFIVDLEGRILETNDAYVNRSGYSREELLQMRISDVNAVKSAAAVAAHIQEIIASGSQCFETLHRTKSGEVWPVEVRVAHWPAVEGRLFAFMTDLTERKRLERQFLQAQKMEAIGRLAGGVAHDFNNLLTVINGNCELLMAAMGDNAGPRESAAQILAAGQTAAGLTRQLLEFSRATVVQMEDVAIDALIESIGTMLQRLIGEHIRLNTCLNTDGTVVHADRRQLEQVIVNLAINARDAMPGGGELHIESDCVEYDASAVPPLKTGRYVRLRVTDTGIGMSDEVRDRVFEPFFTTKSPNAGTGLGLATVHSVITRAGGAVRVESAVGKGSTFEVLLPASTDTGRSAATAPNANARSGSETVLVVEDEEGVRRLARMALELHGYRVLEARSGSDALRIAETHAAPIDLLLTDVVMPVMGGRELVAAIRRDRPELRVLFMSGYTEDDALLADGGEPGQSFIQKPFSIAELAASVRAALDQRAPSLRAN